jgi:putative flavoprotein involved in K+ transport
MLDCLVIGGGQSGLVCGHLLGQAGIRYQVLDATARAGDVWRARPKNLRLFTSRRFCRLGEVEMPGDPNSFPLGREFADHLERFAREKQVAVSYNSRVKHLSRFKDGFMAELEDGQSVLSATVINATGSNQIPVIPNLATELGAHVLQLAAKDYRDASQLPTGSRVAVIGDGASGRQIAQELAAGKHQVFLACGRTRKLVPNTVLGMDLFWWLDKVGLLRAHRDSVVAKIMRKRDPIPASSVNNARLRDAGVVLKCRAVGASGEQIHYQDGTIETVDVVVWCAGYRENFNWVDLPLINAQGTIHDYGSDTRTVEAGYFLVGRKWLSCRASELILGVERDAKTAVRFALAHLHQRRIAEVGHRDSLNV